MSILSFVHFGNKIAKQGGICQLLYFFTSNGYKADYLFIY